MTKEQPKSLFTKLAEVSALVGHVGKDGKNDFHKYRYTSAAAVLAKVNPALAERHIATVPSVEVLGVTDKGMTTVRVRLEFVCGDTGERCTVEGLGSGQDSGDKGVMKAQTAAQKYALKLAFNIDFGDDPEADAETDRQADGRVAGAKAAPKVPRPGASTKAPLEPGEAASYTFRFGRSKGKPIGELPTAEVENYLAYVEKELANPAKSNFKAANERAIEACKAVLASREAMDQPALPGVQSDDGDPFGET